MAHVFQPREDKIHVDILNKPATTETSIKRVEIDRVHTYPQLGLVMNDRLNWEDHINEAITKANRKTALIWKLNSDLPRHALEKIYTTHIRPQLEYAAAPYHNCTREQS